MIAERLEEWVGVIRVLAAEKDLQLSETTDLFLEIDDNSGTCSYWFADHAHRTVFWLHPADAATVGLPKAYSNAHLRKFFLARLPCKKSYKSWQEYALEENYWAHVEMFPATASQYSLTALNELQVILLNARAGKLGNVCVRASN